MVASTHIFEDNIKIYPLYEKYFFTELDLFMKVLELTKIDSWLQPMYEAVRIVMYFIKRLVDLWYGS